MNSFAPRTSKPINWSTAILFTLGFWLSGSLVFDCLIVPGMLTSGMMNEPSFAGASYIIFGAFNHVELFCAAVVLAGLLVFRYGERSLVLGDNKSLLTAGVLLAIALVYTYILTPQMSSMGMPLDLFESAKVIPSSMTIMHLIYWSLEAVKLVAGVILLRSCYRKSCDLA